MLDNNAENLNLFNLILDKLLEEVEQDIAAFETSYDDDYDDWSEDDGANWFKLRTKKFRIRWSASKCVNSKGRTGHAALDFNPTGETVSISINHTSVDIDVGPGPHNKDIKIKFMRLFRKVSAWEAVEIPRREREKFVNNLVQVFPSIMDDLILGGDDDKEKGNG